MVSFLETAFTKSVGRLTRLLAFDLPGPGGKFVPANIPINIAKAGTLPMDLFLCWYFNNWSTSAMLIVSWNSKRVCEGLRYSRFSLFICSALLCSALLPPPPPPPPPIQTALHGSYGAFWILKHFILPDGAWDKKVSLSSA